MTFTSHTNTKKRNTYQFVPDGFSATLSSSVCQCWAVLRARAMYNRGGKGTGGPAGRSTEADVMEKQNDALVGDLQNRIQNLKSITIAIGDEVRDQNKFLDEMQNGMASNDNLLGSTLQKMGKMYHSHGSMSIVYLSLFCIACFIVVYFLMRMGK